VIDHPGATVLPGLAAGVTTVQRGVDIVKVMASGGMGTFGTDILGTQFSTTEMRFLVERAHAAGLPVTAHAHSLSAAQQAVETGVDGIEHCSCLTPTGPAVSDELLDSLVAGGIIVGSALGSLPAAGQAELADPCDCSQSGK
jgi:imidazolonepropionase-like amidohydrolase